MPSLVFVVAFVLSLVVSGLVAVGLVTYLIQSWKQIGSPEDGSLDERLLDGMEQLHMRLTLMGERLDRIEKRLDEGEPVLGPGDESELRGLPGPPRENEGEGGGSVGRGGRSGEADGGEGRPT